MREDDDEFSDENIAAALEAFLAEDNEPLAVAVAVPVPLTPSEQKLDDAMRAPEVVSAPAPVSVASVAPIVHQMAAAPSLPSLPVAPTDVVIGEPIEAAPNSSPISLAQLYAQ